MNFNDIKQFTEAGSWECSYSLASFVRAIEEFEEEGLQLQPDFQREHVWTEEQQIKYIEFILKGGKTGRVIYLNHSKWMGDYDLEKRDFDFVMVDGLQRTTSIKRFINNEIKAFGLYYKEFTGNIRTIDGVRININKLKTKKEVLNWYLEMNEGGTPHTEEELNKVKEMLKSI